MKDLSRLSTKIYEQIKLGKYYGMMPPIFSTDIVTGYGDSDQGEEDQSGDSTTNQNDNDNPNDNTNTSTNPDSLVNGPANDSNTEGSQTGDPTPSNTNDTPQDTPSTANTNNTEAVVNENSDPNTQAPNTVGPQQTDENSGNTNEQPVNDDNSYLGTWVVTDEGMVLYYDQNGTQFNHEDSGSTNLPGEYTWEQDDDSGGTYIMKLVR